VQLRTEGGPRPPAAGPLLAAPGVVDKVLAKVAAFGACWPLSARHGRL